ncbi:MAG TPA: 16S rRNA (adenine(1518)-N(6)/adenine(1519)-N(6))-dimethyltransferase RsmA [Actinomycetota bacterium]|nr:16S rRNA (adenine(1518)-N(6)/adenine(1519)-N(6))-dimethyltransferase RsmA [Actinomycetota bacterium]
MTDQPALLGARRVRGLLDKHGVTPRRALGQNFVVDPNTIRKAVAAAGVAGDDVVLEIGAGAGSLTVGLASAARRVIALEVDPRVLPVLEEAVAGLDNVTVVQADALHYDFTSSEASAIVANLPYNIAATLILKVLEEAPQIRAITAMTQKEVGERLGAAPGGKEYGATSVLVAFRARARVVAEVSRRAFYPVPNVDSVLVRIDRRQERPHVDEGRFVQVVKAAFAQRRKTLRNALAAVAGSPAAAERALAACGIDPSARAEDVDVEGFAALAGELA